MSRVGGGWGVLLSPWTSCPPHFVCLGEEWAEGGQHGGNESMT